MRGEGCADKVVEMPISVNTGGWAEVMEIGGEGGECCFC